MASTKQTSTARRGRVSKAIVGKALKKKKTVKVVNVKLSSKKSSEKAESKKIAKADKTGNKGKRSAKKTVQASKKEAGSSKKARKNNKSSVKVKTKAQSSEGGKGRVTKVASSHAKEASNNSARKLKGNSTKDSAKKSARREEQPKQMDEISNKVVSPTEKLLKPFRAAAKLNQKRAREKLRQGGKSRCFLAKSPRKGKRYLIDLRIHSPATRGYFSPGGVDPAAAIVRLAKVKGLDVVGLTDYYHGGYVDKVRVLSEGSKISIIPGLDLSCIIGDCRSVSVSALFPEEITSGDLFRVLDDLNVPQSAYGRSDYCLKTPFDEVLEIVEKRGGVLIPSRVDKTPYCQLAIPVLVEEFGVHAFDLVHPENPEFFKNRWPDGEFTFFSFSNANALGQIGNRAAKVKLETADFAGLRSRVQRRTRQ